MKLKDIIKTNVQANLGDTMKLVKITSTKTGDQISGNIARINDLIKKLKSKSKKIDSEIKELTLVAKVKIESASEDKELLEGLEEQFKVFQEIQEQKIACNKALEALKVYSPKIAGASKAKTVLEELLENTNEQEEIVRNKLYSLAKNKRPKILLSKYNDFLQEILQYMNSEIIKFNKRHKADVEFGFKNSTYMAEKLGNGLVRFVRYIPIKNIPTFADQTRNLYVAFVTILANPEKMKISMTVLSKIERPSHLNDIKLVDSLIDVKPLLESRFDQFGVNLFETPIRGKDETRLSKFDDSDFKVLKQPGVTIKTTGSVATVTIPKKIYRALNKGMISPDLEKDLMLDMQKFFGFARNKANGRIRLLTPTVAQNSDGSIELKYKRLEYQEVKDSKRVITPKEIQDAKKDFEENYADNYYSKLDKVANSEKGWDSNKDELIDDDWTRELSKGLRI